MRPPDTGEARRRLQVQHYRDLSQQIADCFSSKRPIPSSADRPSFRSPARSGLSSIPSWSAQPSLTFPIDPGLDPSAYEISPRETRIAQPRALADHNRIRVLSMAGVASVRYAVERAVSQPPLISNESPLDRSSVSTPGAGFSVRRHL
jgi:hypothetical protein